MEIYKTFDKPGVKAHRLLPRVPTGLPAQAADARRLREQRRQGRSLRAPPLPGAQAEQTERTGPDDFPPMVR